MWRLKGKLQVINCILHIENNAEWSFSIRFPFFRGLGGKPTKPTVVRGPSLGHPLPSQRREGLGKKGVR